MNSMKSWKQPTDKDVQSTLLKLVTPARQKYFFDRLENPLWLGPLNRLKAFATPPAAIRDMAAGTVAHPGWPEGDYLVRIAKYPEVQNEIGRILGKVDTDNFRVVDSVLRVVHLLPADEILPLLPKVREWLKNGPIWIIDEKLGDIIASLAASGKGDEALNLTRLVFAVEKHRVTGDIASSLKTPLDEWHYKELLEKLAPKIVDSLGPPAVRCIADLLQNAVSISSGKNSDAGYNDYSYVWRPAIEDHQQNLARSIREALVASVRDSAISLIRRHPDALRPMIQDFEGRGWLIFRRLAFHIMGVFHQTATELIVSRALSRPFLEDHAVRHEYATLLHASFGDLPADAQQIFLKWIADGPDRAELARRYMSSRGTPPTQQEYTKAEEFWQRDKLSWIAGWLPVEWKERYDQLVSKHGPADHADFSTFHTESFGITSAFTAEDFKKLTIDQIFETLQQWRETEKFGGPSYLGLRRELASVIADSPASFLEQADRFRSLRLDYVNAFLEGLWKAPEDKLPFNWNLALQFCSWLVDDKKLVDRASSDEAHSLRETRLTVARLLERGLGIGSKAEIPFTLRGATWSVLKSLAYDDDPDDGRENKESFDPAMTSINSVRGEALHCVVRYALWVKNCLEKELNGSRTVLGSESCPEAMEALDLHLKIDVDPSFAIRSIYGHWIPWLHLLDPEWAITRVDTIFPADPELSRYWSAAWNDYIVFRPPYDDVFPILKDQYARAIARAAEGRGASKLEQVDRQLSHHVITLFARGRIALRGDDGLMQRFLNSVGDAVIGEAFHFAGWSLWQLKGAKDGVSANFVNRLQLLWDRRRDVVLAAANLHAKELGAFGWWFASSKFPTDWAVATLIDVLKAAHRIDAAHLVAEELPAIARTHLSETLDILEHGFLPSTTDWNVYEWREYPKDVLAIAVRSVNRPLAERATDMVNQLVERGFTAYRQVLPRPTMKKPRMKKQQRTP